MSEQTAANRCPDMEVCRHGCRWSCFRVRWCSPLSGMFPNDEWPKTMVEAAVARHVAGRLQDNQR